MTDSAAADVALAAGARAIVAGLKIGAFRATDVLASHRSRRVATASLNALVQPCDGDADAAAADLDSRSGFPILAGVPVSVKECFPIRGLVTTLGITHRLRHVDLEDAELVKRLRRAGAVIVGKANVPEAMYLHETTNRIWGRTNHPLDPGRNPGGSTGGDAALVAAGVVPLAVGTDLAGSLRQPAHACGIAAIMPRTAVLGEGGAFDTVPGLTAVRPRAGFLARTVGDLALAMDATVGPAASAVRSPPSVVGWWDDIGPIPASPAVRRAVHEAVSTLAGQGIRTVRIPAAGAFAVEAAWLLLGLLSAEGCADIRALYGGQRPMPAVAKLLSIAGFPPRWRRPLAAALRATGRRIEAEAVLRTGWRAAVDRAALDVARNHLACRFAELVAGCDAVMCPVAAVPAMRHGAGGRLVLSAAPCLIANLLDVTAGAVPVTAVRRAEQGRRRWSLDPVLRAAAATDRGSAGLHVGVQVIAAPEGDEATVLEVMRLIEARRETRS